ncbi:MAG: GIY-YIG nuclease family protein [Pseudorhodoplanes sp.]
MASRKQGTLHLGVTNNLVRRAYEHKNRVTKGFTANTASTGWCGSNATMIQQNAIEREMEIKKWRRAWKFQLIETGNPDWTDLYPEITC